LETGFVMTDDWKRFYWAILAGGMGAGVADIVSAIAGNKSTDPIASVLQYIASAAIGPVAFTGGSLTTIAGLAVHLTLTTIMAALFVLAARRWRVLLHDIWLPGLVYGAAIFFAMFYVIVPHTLAQGWKTPSGFWPILRGAMSHGFFVGLPITSAARHFLGRGT